LREELKNLKFEVAQLHFLSDVLLLMLKLLIIIMNNLSLFKYHSGLCLQQDLTCMIFKALIVKWQVHNIWCLRETLETYFAKKKALSTHNKQPLKEANVFAWMSMISLPCHFLDCSVDNGNMKMVVILSCCGREILIMNA